MHYGPRQCSILALRFGWVSHSAKWNKQVHKTNSCTNVNTAQDKHTCRWTVPLPSGKVLEWTIVTGNARSYHWDLVEFHTRPNEASEYTNPTPAQMQTHHKTSMHVCELFNQSLAKCRSEISSPVMLGPIVEIWLSLIPGQGKQASTQKQLLHKCKHCTRLACMYVNCSISLWQSVGMNYRHRQCSVLWLRFGWVSSSAKWNG